MDKLAQALLTIDVLNQTISNLQIETDEQKAEIDTKNGIIQLHQTIEAKLKDEIDELVDMLEHSCEYMDVDKVKALIAKYKGEQ